MPRAVVCRELGSPDGTAIEDVAIAPLPAASARLRISAIGVNFVDLLMLYGRYQFKPTLPFVPGLEAAGTIAEVSDEVDGFATGDRVMVQARLGAYTDEMMVPTASLTLAPAALSNPEAATVQVGFSTAYNALVERAGLRPGEVLLVLGAGGGVGLAAVELGVLLGAKVVAAASSREKLEPALARGAAHAILTEGAGFRDRVKDVVPQGADVVFDPVGGALLEETLRCLAYGARILVVGFMGGVGMAATNRILIKGASLLGVRAGEAQRRDPATGVRMRAALKAWADKGLVRPHVSHVLPLAEWRKAHRLLEERKAIGRVALTP